MNLLPNMDSALDGFPLMEKYCWLDSTVALHWIRSPGTYKQFVSNRVEKKSTFGSDLAARRDIREFLLTLEAMVEKC